MNYATSPAKATNVQLAEQAEAIALQAAAYANALRALDTEDNLSIHKPTALADARRMSNNVTTLLRWTEGRWFA